jgi:hypothetical protein
VSDDDGVTVGVGVSEGVTGISVSVIVADGIGVAEAVGVTDAAKVALAVGESVAVGKTTRVGSTRSELSVACWQAAISKSMIGYENSLSAFIDMILAFMAQIHRLKVSVRQVIPGEVIYVQS